MKWNYVVQFFEFWERSGVEGAKSSDFIRFHIGISIVTMISVFYMRFSWMEVVPLHPSPLHVCDFT